jgi:PAS domain-containing protein
MGIDIGITITFERAIECYDVDQQSLIRENVENALKNAQPFVFEAPMTRQNDGERRFISVTATPVINEQGQVVKLQGTAQDITRHKLTEQKFRETNNLLQSIVNTTFGGMAYQSAIHNQEGKVVDFKYHMVNAVYAAGLGLSVEEMLGKTILTLFPNLKNTELWLRFLKVMQTAEKYRFIEERHENGADSWYDQQYEKVGDGLLIWQIDVTSIKNLGKDK